MIAAPIVTAVKVCPPQYKNKEAKTPVSASIARGIRRPLNSVSVRIPANNVVGIAAHSNIAKAIRMSDLLKPFSWSRYSGNHVSTPNLII